MLRLLINSIIQQSNAIETENLRLFEHVLSGDCFTFLEKISDLTKSNVKYISRHLCSLSSSIAVEGLLVSDSEQLLELYFVGIAFLKLYIQANWTGPDLTANRFLCEIVSDVSRTCEQQDWQGDDFLKRASLKRLSLAADCEDIYSHQKFPLYLAIAYNIFDCTSKTLQNISPLFAWWPLRCSFILQQIVSSKSSSLRKAILEYFTLVSGALSENNQLIDTRQKRYLNMLLQVEIGLVYHWYKEDDVAFHHFQQAQSYSGLEFYLSGKLGKRTKFQQFDTAQLVLQTSSCIVSNDGEGEKVPREVELNDDQLLNKVQWASPTEAQTLSPEDQCLLLAFCLNFKNTNPSHGLVGEQMQAYVSRILETPINWSIHTMGLLLKSRLEATAQRTAERATLQIQALVDQSGEQMPSDAHPYERLRFIFQLALPPIWELNRELADHYLSLGVVQSALAIYEKLEMWDSIVSCYRILEKTKEAEELVRQRLKIDPMSPSLWCLLGEITQDISYFEKSWELSKKQYARAMRLLGIYYLRQHNYAACAQCFADALSINPIYENIWFSYGCALMHLEQWDNAISAFTRVVSLTPENGEAWNNLASIYIRKNQKLEAFRSLKEALKYKYDDWRIWENFLIVSFPVGELHDTILAFNRLIDLKDRYMDYPMLKALVEAVESLGRIHGPNYDSLKNSLTLLFGRLSSKINNDTDFWLLYADYNDYCGERQKSLDCRLRAYRNLSSSAWETDEEAFDKLAHLCISIAKEMILDGSSKNIFQAKTILRNIILKAEKSNSTNSSLNNLKSLFEEIDNPKFVINK